MPLARRTDTNVVSMANCAPGNASSVAALLITSVRQLPTHAFFGEHDELCSDLERKHLLGDQDVYRPYQGKPGRLYCTVRCTHGPTSKTAKTHILSIHKPSIVDWKNKVVAELGSLHVRPCFGGTVQTAGNEIRTHKLALEKSYSQQFEADHAVIQWQIMHEPMMVSLFAIGSDDTVYDGQKRVAHFRCVCVALSVGQKPRHCEQA